MRHRDIYGASSYGIGVVPSPTLLSPMTNGTTVMPTNGAARLGDATVTSTVPHPTVARPLLTNTTDTLRAARAAGPVANTPRADNSGLVHLPKALLLRLDTTTTPGPNRPTVRTRMPDGASLTTASQLALTTTLDWCIYPRRCCSGWIRQRHP